MRRATTINGAFELGIPAGIHIIWLHDALWGLPDVEGAISDIEKGESPPITASKQPHPVPLICASNAYALIRYGPYTRVLKK